MLLNSDRALFVLILQIVCAYGVICRYPALGLLVVIFVIIDINVYFKARDMLKDRDWSRDLRGE